MFGRIWFTVKVLHVLMDEFDYEPNKVQQGTLTEICKLVREQSLHEYDAAVLFMLVQLKAMHGTNSASGSSDPMTVAFVRQHLLSIERLRVREKLSGAMEQHGLPGAIQKLRMAFMPAAA